MAFFFRTEDLDLNEIANLFVETLQDREIINQLKSRNPTILVGSRGVGKSFLLRMAQKEMLEDFKSTGHFPVYVTFMKGALLQSQEPEVFRAWMLGKISSTILRQLQKAGILAKIPSAINALSGTSNDQMNSENSIESFIRSAENAWRKPDEEVDDSIVPDVEEFRNAIEELKEELEIKRFVFLIDEAAHILLPTQQRDFFTLFRDLRTPYITCNAAVYPGVTSYGDTFQPSHDATVVKIDRDVLSSTYIENMREIVEKQADASLKSKILTNANNFSVLAYAASGNPRILLKTVHASNSLRSADIQKCLRDFYRSEIWKDHSDLAQKYSGHANLVNWGRSFIEDVVLEEVKSKNEDYLADSKPTSAYFWVHRDASARVKSALRILCYTGVIQEHDTGMKATRSQIGTRYLINLGVLFAKEGTPTVDTSLKIARNLTPKRMTEFGNNYSYFEKLEESSLVAEDLESFSLIEQMDKPSMELDLTDWQKSKLNELELVTVGNVYQASLAKFKEAYYVGNVRAKQMRNAAEAAVLEYLSG